MMPAVRAIGILCFALAAGCAGVAQVPPGVVAQTGPPKVSLPLVGAEAPPLAARDEAMAALASPPAGPSQPVMAGNRTIGIEPEAGAPAPQTPPFKSQSAAEPAPAPAKAPVKVSDSPPAAVQPRKIEDPPAVARNPEPPLDVAALKARLRDTNAIGVFTKLALKNQVDDLMKQFQAHHKGGQKSSVASLRQPYDMLVLKVLSAVQDNDPALARTISGSREAIWGILADPERFNSIA
jgi:hypothetical protein